MQRHKSRWKVPTQGNQVLLDPHGNYIPGIEPRGKRYPVPELTALLDRVLAEYPSHRERKDDLKLSWFWWNPKEQGYQGHFGPEAVARLDRKPVLTVSGPVPDWMQEPGFLRRHLRQFIWTRGPASGEARLTVRQVEPQPKELASISLTDASPEAVGRTLDSAWLAYMRERPMVARGYIDNPHGNWLKAVMERAHREEVEVREQALKGALQPPGRE